MNRHCPWCNYHVDCATPIEGVAVPEEGDLMLCLQCGEWGIEAGDGLIRKATDDEMQYIGNDPDCRRARQAWKKISRARALQ